MDDRERRVAPVRLRAPNHGVTHCAFLFIDHQARIALDVEMLLAEEAHKVVSCEVAVADDADVVVVDDAIDHLRIRLRRRTRGVAAGKGDDGLQPVHADMLAYLCPLEGTPIWLQVARSASAQV